MDDVKCEKCDREFTEDKNHEYPGKVYIYKSKVMCEDCLVDMGVSLNEADPYGTYDKTRGDIPPV